MQKIPTKSIGLVILIGIFLLVCTLPVFAVSVEAKTNDYHSGLHQEEHAIPQTSNHPLSYCISGNVIIPPNRLTLNTVIYLAWHPARQIPEPSINQIETSPRNLYQESPHLESEYRCRNGLNSEEPPQV